MIEFIKKIFKKVTPEIKCSTCKKCKRIKEGWYCSIHYSTRKKGYNYYSSICGKQRIKTKPRWCPLIK